jgi:hypothetical protein
MIQSCSVKQDFNICPMRFFDIKSFLFGIVVMFELKCLQFHLFDIVVMWREIKQLPDMIDEEMKESQTR